MSIEVEGYVRPMDDYDDDLIASTPSTASTAQTEPIDVMSGSPRSKEARQKLRRWTFSAEIRLESGQIQSYPLPGLIYGDSAEAQQTSAGLLAKFEADPEAPRGVKIVPIAHETVSRDTQMQLRGLNDQANLATKAAFVLAEGYRLAAKSDKTLLQLVTEAYDAAREQMFPNPAKPAQVDTLTLTDDPRPVQPKRKMEFGIDAVQAALAAA